MEGNVILNIPGRPMTLYAFLIWLGCLAGAGLFLHEGRRLKKPALGLTLILGALLGLFSARLYYVLARWPDLFSEIGLNNFFVAQDEELKAWGTANGAAFWGAVGGVSLGALIAGKLTGEKVSALLDALAPSAALAIALSRFGEYSIGEGIGPDVESEALKFFPLAVMNEWEEWYFAVFMLEGIVGLVILVLLMTRGRHLTDGYRARMFLILYSAAQVFLEALRRDNFLRLIIFVRVSQVVSAVVLLFVLVFGVIRWRGKNPDVRIPEKKVIFCCALFAVMVPLVIALEFAVDKSPDLSVGMAYLLEMLCCAAMGWAVWQTAMKN